MFVSLERIADDTDDKIVPPLQARIMTENLPYNIIKPFANPCFPVSNFVIQLANTPNTAEFIELIKTYPVLSDNLLPDEGMGLLYDGIRHDLDILVKVCSSHNRAIPFNYMFSVYRLHETMIPTCYAPPDSGQSTILSERTVAEVDTHDTLIALLIVKFSSELTVNVLRSVKKCPVCGKYFIPDNYSGQTYCSKKCKDSGLLLNPYYKAFRNTYKDIQRGLPSDDYKPLYQEWRSWVESLLATAETSFDTAKNFQKAIRAEWNKRKKTFLEQTDL